MKTASFLCAVLGVGLLLASCAHHHRTTVNDDTSRRGLVGPGSVAPIYGGPDRPRQTKQRFQP